MIIAAEFCVQGLVRMDVGAHHSAINILEEGLDETLHSVIKLVVS